MQSKAKTVDAYLASLPADRRAALQAVRKAILADLDPDLEEGMSYGMIGYYVPHRVFPAGYHCDPKVPLPYAGLASQKNHMSLYLMTTYDGGEEAKWLREQWQRAGKKLDMGKCCIRFKKLEDLPLDVVAEAFRRVPARAWIAYYESVMDPRTGRPRSSRPKAAPRAAKPAAKQAAKPKVGSARPATKGRKAAR